MDALLMIFLGALGFIGCLILLGVLAYVFDRIFNDLFRR